MMRTTDAPRRLLAILMAMSALSMALTAIVPTASASEGDIHIFAPTVPEMNVDMDDSVTYRWGIFNNGTHPHAVLIDVSGAEHDWHATVSNDDSYFVLNSGEFMAVDLNVTAPDNRDYAYSTIMLNATVRDLVTEEQWMMPLGSVNTTITGGAYVPPTKVLGWFDDPLGDYIPALDNEWGVFLTTVIVWLVIGLAIYFILDPMVKMFTAKTKTDLDDKLLAIVKGPVFWIILTYGIISSLEVLNFPWSVVHALDLIYTLTLIFLFSWMGFRIFKDILIAWGKSYAARTETTIDDILLPLFEKVGMIAIVAIAIIATLNLFGVDVTLLMAGMGVAGLVIAFAAQETLSNFISGMFLLTDRPFKVGDLIQIDNGDYCRVEHIGIRSTQLYNTFDHDMIVVPNNKIANERVVNLNMKDNMKKMAVTVSVGYDSDVKRAKEIMLDIAAKHPDIIHDKEHATVVRLTDFQDSAIQLKMFTWVHDLNMQWKAGSDIREEILRRFAAEGIEIPYPQQVVHVNRPGAE